MGRTKEIRKRDFRRMKGNPTLLNLLLAEARVVFPDGSWIEGDVEGKMIMVSNGREPLSSARALHRKGVELALQDLEEARLEDTNGHLVQQNTLGLMKFREAKEE